MLECLGCKKLFSSRFRIINHIKDNEECEIYYIDKTYIKEENDKNCIIRCCHCGISIKYHTFAWIHERLCRERLKEIENVIFLRKIYKSCENIKESCDE